MLDSYLEPPEDKPICHCDRCHNEMYKGDQFAYNDGEYICYECLRDFGFYDWLELIDLETVERSFRK